MPDRPNDFEMEKLSNLVNKYKNLEIDKAGHIEPGPIRSKVLLHPDPNLVNADQIDLPRGQYLVFVTDG